MTGFIVTSRRGCGAYELGRYPDTPRAGILIQGDKATLFATRSRAYAAIRRTKRYAKKHGLDWATWALRVQRLAPQGPL